MNARTAIFRYELTDALRSRWSLMHGLFYLLVAEGLLLTSGWVDRTLLGLINVVLLLVPLVSLVFGAIHFYNQRDFMKLMLTQPVRRSALFAGMYAGFVLPLAATFALAVFLPFTWHGGLTPEQGMKLLILIGLGVVLTAIFGALALAISIRFADRVRGIGVALLGWFFFSVMYDGLVLLLVSVFGHLPVERAFAGVMLANPVDLARLILLVHFDAAAMMGYTGAVITRFFGSGIGMALSVLALFAWTCIPLILARRRFERMDF